MEEWAPEEGLQDWSWSDLLQLHAERFAPAPPDTRQLLDNLQAVAAKPQPSDAVDSWLAPHVTEALAKVGVATLDDLRRRIAVGGRWWSILPAYGAGKGARLAAQLDGLLGPPEVSTDPLAWRLDAALARLASLEAAPGANRAPTRPGGTAAADDRAAIAAWLDAKAR